MANLVKGEGSLQSKTWLIGEAPGKNEDAQGRPFVGGAGVVLDGILKEAGINRSECYVDNVIRYQPLNNNFGIYYKDSARLHPKEELIQAHKRLREMVSSERPNIVVALGNEALYALTGHKQITKWRGSILGCAGVKVIPTIHPAMIMRQYEYRTQSLFDFSKVKREAATPNFPKTKQDNFVIGPSFKEVMDYFKLLRTKTYISFDIETSQTLQQIVCIGFAWSASDAICIPIFSGDTSFWNQAEEMAIIKEIKNLFAMDKKFIAQNAQFDMAYLRKQWGVDVPYLWQDSMIAHHCVYPELPKGLGFLVSIYTNHPYHKDKIHGGLRDFWNYNCMDAARTWECAIEIEKEAKEFGTWDFYQEHSHKLIRPLFEMQMQGCRINVKARAELDTNLAKDKLDMEARLERAIGHPININSPKQMKQLLFEEFRFPPIYRKRKDAKTRETRSTLSADDEALADLDRRFPGNPMFKLIQDIRKVSKLLSTYVRAPLDEDERIRCCYVISGTETGRLSSRASVFGSGSNLQNIPRGELIRSLFIPDEGYKFVNVDLSQAEARVVAFLSKEERLQAVFEQGGDVHRRNASLIFKKPLAAVSSEERDLGKRLVHAANYGIGNRKFAHEIGSSDARASELLNAYFANYPRIRRWHDEVRDELRSTRTLITPLGRKRMFFGRWNDDLLRMAVAFVPQSTVGDLLNMGLVRAYKNLPIGWSMVLQVHDSVLLQVPEETDAMHIHKFLHHYFEIPLTIHNKEFIIPVDIKWGSNWGNLEKLEV